MSGDGGRGVRQDGAASPHSSVHLRVPGFAAAVAALGPLCEVYAARTVAGWQEPQRWLPDLLVGWMLVLVAAVAARRDAPAGRVAAARLVVAAAALWFFGTAVPGTQLWHRGPLVHLLVTTAVPPERSRTRWLLVAAGYLAALLPAAPGAAATAAVVVVVVVVSAIPAPRRLGNSASAGTRAAQLALALAWAAATVAGSASRPGYAAAGLLAYQALACAVAAVCVAASGPAPDLAGIVVEAVELGAGGASGLQRALRRAVRDDALLVGTWSPAAGAFVDPDGTPLMLPAGPGEGRTASDRPRAVTFVTIDGLPRVVVHAAGLLDRFVLEDAVRAATRVERANQALQGELAERVAEVERSRRRLVVTADEERRALGRRLQAGPRRRLAAVLRRVETAAGTAPGAQHEHLAEAARHLRDTLADLDAVASGLHPADLDAGLSPALRRVAARSPVPVEVALDDAICELGVDEATALYYTAAEALANVIKHAGASRAWLRLRREADGVALTVRDNGGGAARLRPGGGLAGLGDRLAALGGRLDVGPADGGGTHVTATVPVAPFADAPLLQPIL